MNWIRPTLFLATALLISAGVFWTLQRGLASSWLTVGVHPEVLGELDASLQDQRKLAQLDPENEAEYRQDFEARAELVQRLRVLRHARGDVVRRYEQILLAIFGFAVALVTAGWLWRQHRQQRRLEALRLALADLARGEAEVRVGPSAKKRRVTGRDLIGRIAAMVEETSRVMTRDRHRLKALENLSAWQEAARRHAHEMRTPLTAARLELRRLEAHLGSEEAREATEGVSQELDRLGEFARRFTSFARLPSPRKVRRDLGALVRDIASTFEGAWPNLTLQVEQINAEQTEAASVDASLEADIDGEMLRQVLVNLVDNASHAMAAKDQTGVVTIRLDRDGEAVHLDVSDDGPGIDASVRTRLFEPYTTTRGIGEGMGLGLAICRKILLDHGGELELVESSERGTTFRLTFPVGPQP